MIILMDQDGIPLGMELVVLVSLGGNICLAFDSNVWNIRGTFGNAGMGIEASWL